MQHRLNCGAGELQIISAILDRSVIHKILDPLGLDPQPPPKGRAREPGPHFAATLQPGWRCARCRHNAVHGRVNPETEAGTGPLERSRTCRIGATRRHGGQIQALQPAADRSWGCFGLAAGGV